MHSVWRKLTWHINPVHFWSCVSGTEDSLLTILLSSSNKHFIQHQTWLPPPSIHSLYSKVSQLSRTCAVERPWTSGSQKQHNVPNSQYINPSRIMHELSTITRQCTRTLWGQQPRIKATQTKLVKIRWWNQRFLFQGSINLICSALSFWSRSHYRFSDVTCPCFILF